VVAQFAKVAHQTDFMYCYSVLESNKRGSDFINHGTSPTRHRSGSTASAATTPAAAAANPAFLRGSLNDELNTFFPFDPYRLPKSNVFIQAVYREWSSVAIGDDDESDSDDDEEGEDAEEEGGDSSEEEQEGSGDDSEGSSKTSRFLAIPGAKKQDADDDGGLGESLVAMSISPRLSESVKMGSIPPISSPFSLS
jgi:RNA polymerase I-specific transcription initiation factor RRN3